MPATITVYGGAGTVGGNKVLLEDQDTSVMFDFGTSFDARFKYFEQFLVPRSRTGLLDLIHMGLLPPLRGLYRSDLDDSGRRILERAQRYPHYRDCRLDAVLLSHAHIDHCGYISFLDPSIPILSTAMTAYLCKAIQDCGAYQFEGEMCYAVPKGLDDEGTVGAVRPKVAPFIRRPYFLTDAAPPDPRHLWDLPPTGRRGRYFPPHSLGLRDRVGPLRLRYFPVDHSIHGAAAMAVETSAGWVVYTGDLRLHGKAGHSTLAFVEEAAQLRPVALVCEGTNVERGPGPTEDEVFEACLEEVRKAESQFVVADFGARNIERLLTFLEIARLTDRRLVIMDKDAYLLAAMQAVDPTIPTPASEPLMRVYRRTLREPRTWVENVRDWFPDQVTSSEVHRNPGAFIVCMSFFDVPELIDIDPSSGIWVYSSSEPHNEEQQFELWRLGNWLDHFHIVPFGLTESPSRFHASGHISGMELFDLVRRIAPARIIPVHTTAPERFRTELTEGLTVAVPEVGVSIPL